jgi:hypothetical protein
MFKNGIFLVEDPSTLSIWKDAPKTFWLNPHCNIWTQFHLLGVGWYMGMENYILMKLQTRGNIKLQLGTSQPTIAWIFWLLFQVHWVNKGNGCCVNIGIMYCNMSCFVWSLKISFISQLGVAMKFIACWLIL